MSFNLRGKPYVWISVIVGLALTLCFYHLLNSNDTDEFSFTSQDHEKNASNSDLSQNKEEAELTTDSSKKDMHNYDNEKLDQDSTDKSDEVTAYISGAVKDPGVYSLPVGSRLFQLLEKAGGEQEDALLEYLNLAAPLQDGEHIHVFKEGDDLEDKEIAVTDSTVSDNHNSAQTDKVNINNADASTLETLPGIGPVRADSIISYRETTGNFQRTDQIMEINGIGTGIYDQVKDMITVD